jgi:hypothetical protein
MQVANFNSAGQSRKIWMYQIHVRACFSRQCVQLRSFDAYLKIRK